MFNNRRITFIGPGAMAEGMIYGLIHKSVVKPESITASGPIIERQEELKSHYGIDVTANNSLAASKADVIIISVKPQVIDRVLEDLKGFIKPDALVLSIVAGTSIQKIMEGTDHDVVVRCMPNTPAQIGQGITVWYASPGVTDEQYEMTRKILRAFGDEIYVEEEYYLDMATALSGTGPAYVFLFMEAMVDAGVHLGFSRKIAEQLVAQTVRGSVDYFQNREDLVHLARLRNEVTSPGGTSAAALYYLEKAGFRTAISRAIWAAYVRSQELGKDVISRPPEQSSNNSG